MKFSKLSLPKAVRLKQLALSTSGRNEGRFWQAELLNLSESRSISCVLVKINSHLIIIKTRIQFYLFLSADLSVDFFINIVNSVEQFQND